MNRIFNIKDFSKYLNITELKNEDLHIINFENEKKMRQNSPAVTIDFYLLAIKPPLGKALENTVFKENQADSYMYADCPQNTIEWDFKVLERGFTIMVSKKYLAKEGKEYNFVHYNNHEALFLSKDEELILWDLYKKAYDEFQKINYSREVILSYIKLILSYAQIFYDRQFDSRSTIYNKVIEDFNLHLSEYFSKTEEISGLPSVAYFAQKANLSANYFGDLIKHFTGESPIEHIHNYVLKLAKNKLKNTTLSVSEISYSLGFDYPNYFARFFRKKTGMSPKVFRSV